MLMPLLGREGLRAMPGNVKELYRRCPDRLAWLRFGPRVVFSLLAARKIERVRSAAP